VIGTQAVSECKPRWATQATPGRKTRGPEVAAVAKAIGYELMDWQRQVLDVGLELLDDGQLAYREIIVTCPRQVGKTVLTLSWEIHRCIMWGNGPQNVAFTAQTGHDAREKLLQDQLPLLEAKDAPIREAIERIHRASGSEGVSFSNGSRLFILNSGEDAGHGKVCSLAIIDEAFADFDDRREQSLLPAMITKRDAQIVVISTAGTERSAYLKRKIDLGRACVANGENENVAYFEWSADPDADPGDPETWKSCIPSYGITIDERSLRHSQKTMPPAQFARAFLNLWSASDERVLPAHCGTPPTLPTSHPKASSLSASTSIPTERPPLSPLPMPMAGSSWSTRLPALDG
jgi:phage terminase large subunit-like protein